jgi:glycosyltransferase involved in cell wall biosynthesis
MKTELVTIIIPLYNHEHYVADAINGILNQSLQDFKIIIIDDFSIDNSLLEVKKI